MSRWEMSWTVTSESNPNKSYTVSRADDGTFGCSCPAWTFNRKTCKHIRGVVNEKLGVEPADVKTANKLRFVSKMHYTELNCENCRFYDELKTRFYKRGGKCKEGRIIFGDNPKDLLLVKKEAKTFYTLGRCCKFYEIAKDK